MLLRIGDKIINSPKIHREIDKILELRGNGLSQQEVAQQLGIDRTFISRLESIGEVRKGGRVALIGFPIKNCEEIQEVAREEGIEYCLLLSEKERMEFIEEKPGKEIFESIMEIISSVRQYDIVILMASNMRIKSSEKLLDNYVVGIEIGKSPISEDVYVSPQKVKDIIRDVMK
ncbi:helix-turn-helix domain-containing protein [Selenomonadales bacterium OttesenSCG-928-I06]|nr:helix-turn-helix domain-containing protein [Selenomonadales bacterium OttesenSCG-928-I06]